MDLFYLYILASRNNRHLTIGVAAQLSSAVRSERLRVSRRLAKKRVLQKLVYVESIRGVDEAIKRDQQLKKFSRMQLGKLVEAVNPGWDGMSLSALEAAGFSQSTRRRQPV